MIWATMYLLFAPFSLKFSVRIYFSPPLSHAFSLGLDRCMGLCLA
jgi:hypothetical protein